MKRRKQEVKMPDHIEVAKQYAELKDKKDQLEADVKKVNAEIETVQLDLVNLMVELSLQNFKLDDGRLFSLVIEPFPRIKNQDEFYQWLEENNEEYIIKRTIHNKTLRSWYKQFKEKKEKEGSDEEFTETMKGKLEIFEKTQVRVKGR